MSMSAEAAGFCLVSQVTTADTRAIEAGLNELWRLAEAGEPGGAIVRAASMTLLVPVGDERRADAVPVLLGELIETHPCRAILLLPDDLVGEPRARLASHLKRSGEGEPARYWEEIRLVGPVAGLHQAMSAVATLALPNLPVQTWWPGEPQFDGDLYNHVLEVSDRVLIDSSRFRSPDASLPVLATAIDVAHGSIAFADLSWTRLTPWRLMTAEFFDDPVDHALLDSIERVRVGYVRGAGGEAAQALLLVGWLGSRLGWEPRDLVADGDGWRFVVVDGIRPVQIEIAHLDDGAPGLRSVRIETAERGQRATYTIEGCGDDDEARTVKVRDDVVQLEGYAHLPPQTEVELLREELGGFVTDRIYHESLALVGRLLGAPASSSGPGGHGPGRDGG